MTWLLTRDWQKTSEVFENWAVGIAAIIAGLWALSRFLLERSHETALQIEMDTTQTSAHQGLWLVYFDVVLANLSTRMLTAMPRRFVADERQPVYDLDERLEHACSLQIKRIRAEIPAERLASAWTDSNNLEVIGEEIDLLADYGAPQREDDYFWMEPKESYHVGAAVNLSPGNYLCMVTFIGKDLLFARKPFEQFWRRTFFVCVPKHETTAKPKSP